MVLSFLLVILAQFRKERAEIQLLHDHERVYCLFEVRKSQKEEFLWLLLFVHCLSFFDGKAFGVPVLESLLHNFFIVGGELSLLDLQGFLNSHGLDDRLYFRPFYFRSLNGAAKVQEGYAVRHNPNRPVAWLTLESVGKSFVQLKFHAHFS